MKARFQKTWPEDRMPGEHNDCTVRALMAACDAPYADVHRVLASWGRRPRHGMTLLQIRRQQEILGRKMVEVPIGYGRKPTFAAVLPRLRTGRYLVVKTGHAFAVVDGVVRDGAPVGSRSRIWGVWQIEAPSPKVEVPPLNLRPYVPPADLKPYGLPFAPAPVPPVDTPWIVTRYVELRKAGKLDNAVRLFNNATPKMQELMKLAYN